MKVIKRDKRTIQPFQLEKIRNAVEKAFKSKDKELDEEVINDVKNHFDLSSEDAIGVEDVQDIVEDCLMKKYPDVAKAYIIYRYEHKVIRDDQSKLIKQIRHKLSADDVQNQNANVDEYSFGGRMGEATRIVTKKYALDNCMTKRSRENHLNNEIYIHDLDSYAVSEHNCLTLPFDELLSRTVKTRQTDIRPANSINTAFQLIAVYFQIQSLQQFGGVAAGHIDWTMVPYYRKSFYKHFLGCYVTDALEKEFSHDEIVAMGRKKLRAFKKAKEAEFREKYNIEDETFRIGDFSMQCVNFHLDDERIKDINLNWYDKALLETQDELNQAVEGMYHNLNSLQSRSGCQLPFTSINYGTCTLPEGRNIIRALLEGSMNGVGEHHLTPIFPCGIFQCMKGVNRKEGDPNYDLFKLALKSTSRRIYPNYANVDWSVNAGYDRNNPRTYMVTMGCRTYNGYDINGLGQMKDGRGNLAPVTIIMPTLAMEAERDTEKFMKLLDKKIGEAKDMLLERYERMCKQSPKAASFMWENETMFGFDPKVGPESALRHGTLAIGQIALAETLNLLINKDQTTDEGMVLAKRIEKLFNDRCKEFKQQYHLNFGVYLTPAENLCYTSFNKFKDKYGDIEGVTYYTEKDKDGNDVRVDKKFFTNSIHVPVWKEMDPFEKIDIESQLTGYSNAGCITYVEMPTSAKNNIEAMETIVNYAMDHDIPYFAVNLKLDQCADCGYTDEIGDTCPECGSHNIEHLRRVTGYLSTTYEHFNLGKQDEVEKRVEHRKEF